MAKTKKKDKTPFLFKAIRWGYPILERRFPWLAFKFFAWIFFTPFRYPTPEREKGLARSATRFTVTIQGSKKIQGYAWGEAGPYVLFVHGWAGRGTQFSTLIEAFLEAGYRAIAFDGPAHGLSDGRTTELEEFRLAIKAVVEKSGPPEGIIAHSFGGSASLYAIMHGLNIKRLVNIAVPTIADEIIHTYLRAVGGTGKSKDFFKADILQKTGKPFDEFTPLWFIQHISGLPMLVIHDRDDKEVPLVHAEEFKKIYPEATLYLTQGLGHNRILRDGEVIRECLTFFNPKVQGQQFPKK